MDRFQRDYVSDNWEKFIKESRYWAKDIKKLEKDLEEVTFLKGASDNIGRGPDISKPVESIAIRRDKILTEIKELEFLKEMFDYGWNALSEDEQSLLDGMIFTDRRFIDAFVDFYGIDHGDVSRQWVYKLKGKALEKFGDAIKDKYGHYFAQIGRL